MCEGRALNNKNDIPNEFNTFIANVGPDMVKKIVKSLGDLYVYYFMQAKMTVLCE